MARVRRRPDPADFSLLLNDKPESPPPDRWVLIRRARQLLTLQGPSGPRRGSAMRDLHIVNDGSLLIHNGVIRESGPTQRIESLREARGAREFDALGKVVMPAFVDPDAVLIAPPTHVLRTSGETRESALRALSKRRVEAIATASAASWIRLGALSVGAHTGYACDLRETARILRIHQRLQGKPLRIRSIFSPRGPVNAATLIDKWLPALRRKQLATVLDLNAGGEGCLDGEDRRQVAIAGAGLGYSLRIRTSEPPDAEICGLALEGGAVALVSDVPPSPQYAGRLTTAGCVHVIPADVTGSGGPDRAPALRAALDEGAALALASNYRPTGPCCFNPQHLLHLATERLGLTEEEAIMAAVWNAACSLRMSHATASLEPGKSADILVMDVPDYRELARRAGHSDVQMVMRAGHPVYRRGALILD